MIELWVETNVAEVVRVHDVVDCWSACGHHLRAVSDNLANLEIEASADWQVAAQYLLDDVALLSVFERELQLEKRVQSDS